MHRGEEQERAVSAQLWVKNKLPDFNLKSQLQTQYNNSNRSHYGLVFFVLVLALMAQCTSSLELECPKDCQCPNEWRNVVCFGGQLEKIIPRLEVFENLDLLTMSQVAGAATLKTNAFKDIEDSQLTKLTITESSIKMIETDAIRNLTSLERLDLSDNALTTIDDRLFYGLNHLKTLILSGNRLASLGDSLISLPGLVSLDLSRNGLQTLPSGMFTSQGVLSDLILDGNPLKNLYSQSFQGLTNIRKFSARDCSLSSVENSVLSSMKKLVYLDLGHNRLSSVSPPGVLSAIIHLKTVRLDNNKIQALDTEHFSALHLQTLDLSHNRISDLDVQAFSDFTLKELDLSYNTLVTLDNAIFTPVAEHLTALNLAGNPFREMEALLFSELKPLKAVNVSSCALSQLSAGMFHGLPNLQVVDISHNNLHSIPVEVLTTLGAVDTVKLDSNDWVCDCQIQPFHVWLQKALSANRLYCVGEIPGNPAYNTEQPPRCIKPACTAPSILADTEIATMTDEQFTGCDPDGDSSTLPASVQGAIVASCMGFALILLSITIYMWKRGKTHVGLKRVCVPSHAESSHEEENEDKKVSPLENCDRASLAMSDHNFVFRHYFDHLVTDPKLMSRTSDSDDEDKPSGQRERDSLYSSQPSLYSNHSTAKAAFGVESTV